MMTHFLKKENTHVVDEKFVLSLREFFIILMFTWRSRGKKKK